RSALPPETDERTRASELLAGPRLLEPVCSRQQNAHQQNKSSERSPIHSGAASGGSGGCDHSTPQLNQAASEARFTRAQRAGGLGGCDHSTPQLNQAASEARFTRAQRAGGLGVRLSAPQLDYVPNKRSPKS